jgi:hypothetical protein
MARSVTSEVAKTLILSCMFLLILIYFATHYSVMEKGIDFPHFYSASKIVLSGNGHKLYDLKTQNDFIVRYSGRVGPYFNHPPFETLFYIPAALSTISRAYLIWCLFNGFLLVNIAILLKQYALPYDWRILVLFFLLFVPVLLNILQGQDSLLLLFFFASAFAAIRADSDFTTGMLLACGLFKFHLALPAAIPFMANSRRVFCGFVTVAVAILLISADISGWGVFTAYPGFLMQINNLPLAGIQIHQMANLRGMFWLVFPNNPRVALIVTIFSSLLVFSLSVREWIWLAGRSSQTKNLAFANVMTGAILVSYHLSPHDLSILLLPIVVTLKYVLSQSCKSSGLRIAILVSLGLLFLPPMHVWLLHLHSYPYAGIPIVVLFFLTHWEIERVARSSTPIRMSSNHSTMISSIPTIHT